MTIKSVNYTPDSVVLEIESLSVSAGREIIENKKKIGEQEATGRATSYDTDTDKWITPTLLNSWVDYGGGYTAIQYTKDNFGFVHLKGVAKDGTIGSDMFTLPAGYRLSERARFGIDTSSNAHGRCDIRADGGVNPAVGSNTYFSLDGITFKAEQ